MFLHLIERKALTPLLKDSVWRSNINSADEATLLADGELRSGAQVYMLFDDAKDALAKFKQAAEEYGTGHRTDYSGLNNISMTGETFASSDNEKLKELLKIKNEHNATLWLTTQEHEHVRNITAAQDLLALATHNLLIGIDDRGERTGLRG